MRKEKGKKGRKRRKGERDGRPYQKSVCAHDGDRILHSPLSAGRIPRLQYHPEGGGTDGWGDPHQPGDHVRQPFQDGKGRPDLFHTGGGEAEDLPDHGSGQAGSGTGDETDRAFVSGYDGGAPI